jgi:hypothetical protein
MDFAELADALRGGGVWVYLSAVLVAVCEVTTGSAFLDPHIVTELVAPVADAAGLELLDEHVYRACLRKILMERFVPLARDLVRCQLGHVEQIELLTAEHETVGDLLEELNRVTSGYATPADGCASYAACLRALAELEADTHLHVHKENNVLFPAARVERRHRRRSTP